MKKFNTNADLDYACRQLAAQDAGLAHVYETYGPPRMRRQPTGFAGLVRILIGQQVSIAAAAAIQSRVDALLPETTPQAWLGLDDAELAACGVSAPKRRYLSGLAQAILDKRLRFSALHRAENDVAHEMLTALTGIGPWTADCCCCSICAAPTVFRRATLPCRRVIGCSIAKTTAPMRRN